MTFSASLASRMYLSRTRLSQMRRGGAPRTGRPRGSSSKDNRSSRAGHSRKKSQAGCEAEGNRRAGLEKQVHTSCSSLGLALQIPTFQALRFCFLCLPSIPLPHAHPTPQLPAPLLGPNFNPAVTEASPLADHGACCRIQVTTTAPLAQQPFFSRNPQTSSRSPGHILPFPGTPPSPAGTWRLPHPLAFRGPRQVAGP